MQKIFYLLISFFLISNWILAQDQIVTVTSNVFTPADITVQVGDVVEWQNQGGFHNVNGSQAAYPDNPEGFDNGGASSAAWTFSHTFTIPGTYNYHCDPHVSLGMKGTVTVTPGQADDLVITEIMYNAPGTDAIEFIELFNNSAGPIDLTGYAITEGVEFTFPSMTLNSGEYFVVTIDSVEFLSVFGFSANEWIAGALSNGGEDIVVEDAMGNIVDSVDYDDGGAWPEDPDGSGSTLILCDPSSDNADPANWRASYTETGIIYNGLEILGSPGEANTCVDGPYLSFSPTAVSVNENGNAVEVMVIIQEGNQNPTSVTVSVDMSSTAVAGEDFTFSETVLTFPANVAFDTQFISIPLINDGDEEDMEEAIFTLINVTNNATVKPNADPFILTIFDDDTQVTASILITGVFDAQPAGAGTKGFELKVLEDIPDLSVYGVGSANNGGGSSGVEFPFPAVSASKDDCIYVADDSIKFFNFFGFYPNYAAGAANINGDDAIELFEDGQVIDVFGEISVDGTGQPWEYMDGWAYRKNTTGPDGPVFVLDNWDFSGINALDNVPNNNQAPNPFPVCSYLEELPSQAIATDDNASTKQNEAVTINVLLNDVLPIGVNSVSIVDDPPKGSVTVNMDNTITYEPGTDECGSDQFTYEVCDDIGCDTATVNINIICFISSEIGSVTTLGTDGKPDSVGKFSQLRGIVHGVDLQGTANLQFALIDNTGGITVFADQDFGYTVNEGDEMIVRGVINSFNCLTQIVTDTLWMVSSGNSLVNPIVVTGPLGEEHESELIRINNLTLVDAGEWLTDGMSFNARVTDGSTDTFSLRIDSDVNIAGTPAPVGTFDALGIGGQFDSDGVCDGEGYQFLPRYLEDIILITATKEADLQGQIMVYPNPASDFVVVESEVSLDVIRVYNILGQQVLEVVDPEMNTRLDLSDFESGMYVVSFLKDGERWSKLVMKK